MKASSRIALANISFPATPAHAVELARQTVKEAGDAGAEIVCFPECFVPGYRRAGAPFPPPDAAFLERAWSAKRYKPIS